MVLTFSKLTGNYSFQVSFPDKDHLLILHIGLWCTCLSGFVGCLGVHVEICVSVYIGLEVCSCMCLGLVNRAFLLFQCVCLIESDCVFVCLCVCL